MALKDAGLGRSLGSRHRQWCGADIAALVASLFMRGIFNFVPTTSWAYDSCLCVFSNVGPYKNLIGNFHP